MTFVNDRDFLIEVAKGNVPGHSLERKFGSNQDVDTTTDPEDIWITGGVMTWPTAAATLSVVSTSTDDDGSPAGVGAQVLTIAGLDSSFNDISENVTLDGTTPVATSSSFIRVQRAFVAQTGTYHDSNAGVITATLSGNTMFTINADQGQTLLGRYTVPNGKTAYLVHASVNVDTRSSRTANIRLYQLPNADDVSAQYTGAKRVVLEFLGVAGQVVYEPLGPLVYSGKTDLWWSIEEVSANDTAVSVDWTMLVVDD